MNELDALLSMLNLSPPAGNHHPCPFHADSTGSLSIYYDGMRWKWKCHAGCGGGGVEEAAARMDKDLPTYSYKACGEKVSKWPVPRPNVMSELKRGPGFEQVMETRKISIEVADAFFLAGDRRETLIPITDPSGREVAVKIHRHSNMRPSPKCGWLAVGTVPPEKPKHGVSTLFPRPELWNKLPKLYICPGELKALRVITMGRQAVSPTAGESFNWPDDELDRLRGFRTVVIYDDDEAGYRFRDKTQRRLRGAGIPCKAITCGRRL